jgi:monoamine oxidase
MASVIEAVGLKLPAETIHLEHVLTAVFDRGTHVELHFRHGDALITVEAKRVVLAVPPRLLDERVRFEPELTPELIAAMQDSYTWMASTAKAVLAYDKPTWREAGRSGNAFVTHGQAVLGEIFDACDTTGTRAAIGGFLALNPELRASFIEGLPMLLGNQMGQVFGAEFEHGEQHYKDWAADEFTCARLDYVPPEEHPHYGNPILRQTWWDGKLFFGASETASYAGGYMEGALDAARRLLRDVGRYAPSTIAPVPGAGKGAVSNAESVAAFAHWVGDTQADVLSMYKKTLNKLMASPDKEILTQRAMVATIEQVFSSALMKLEDLSFDMSTVAIQNGRSDLTPEILGSFKGFIEFMLDSVIEANRTSCALSNFPGEDKLGKDYLQAILRDIAAAWKEFCLSVNSFFVSHTPEVAAA